jgi:hypothetical protein
LPRARERTAYIARYALGRDYHKVLRRRLQALAGEIERGAGPMGYRVFVDSAPVLEKALARDAGLGWIGKHTNLLDGMPAPGSSSEKSSPICRCRPTGAFRRTAARVPLASTCARRARSSDLTSSTRGAASRT